MKDETLDFFEWYDLYDIPIVGLSFEFETNTVTLRLNSFSAELDGYVPLHLVFKGLHKYTFDYPHERFLFDMLAIYRATISKNKENDYEVTLLIDMERIEDGNEFTVGKMLIGFKEMEVVGGENREQMAARYKEVE